jgi:hypothetical protein
VYDIDKQKPVVLEYLRERAREFKKNPEMAVRFFSGKNASQWNNPDYQGIWNNRILKSDIVQPYYIYYLFSAPGAARVSYILNYMQFILFFGVVAFVFLERSKDSVSLFYAVTVVGGFIFHTFWEAKCHYTIPFVMLLLPLSVNGYKETVNSILTIRTCKRRKQAECTAFLMIFFIIACIIRFSDSKLLNDVFIRREDTEEYNQYVLDRTYMRLKSGEYILSISVDGREFSLTEGEPIPNDSETGTVELSETQEKVLIGQSEMNDDFYVQFPGEGDRCLDVADGQGEEGKSLQACAQNGRPSQNWNMHQSRANDKVNILFGTYWALTIDKDSHAVYLSQFTDSENQQWSLTYVEN